MDYRTISIACTCTQRFCLPGDAAGGGGLPQAGILANKLLRQRLLPHGYYECANTPGLWKHEWRPISFTLVVDDFGVKYIGQEHVNHLIRCLKEAYALTED